MTYLNYLTAICLFLCLAPTSPSASSEQLTITLQDGLRMAFDRNEILRVARGDVDRAHTFVNEAFGDGLPQVRASATYNRNWKLPTSILDGPDGPVRFTFGTKNNLSSSLILRQSLYAGGGIAAGWRESRQIESASTSDSRLLRSSRSRADSPFTYSITR